MQAVALAVSETVTNAVVHAYDGHGQGPVRVSCHADGERFVVEVVDRGPVCGYARTLPGSATDWPWWARWRTRLASLPAPTGAVQP